MMKKKLIYNILSIILFLATTPMLAQGRQGPGGPGDGNNDPGLPIDDHIWILIIVAVVFGVFTIKAMSKKEKAVLK